MKDQILLNNNATHEGQLLKEIFVKENINIAHLAKMLNVNRGTIYFWFKKRNITKEKFYEIGYIINYDFGYIFKNNA